MMMFIGLILLVVYAVGTIKGGFFIETLKEGRKLDEYTNSEEFNSKSSDEQEKYALGLLVKMVVAFVSSILMMLLTLCFLIGALSIDIILVPTVVLIALLVIKSVRVSVSKEYREKINKRELGTFRSKLSNFVYFLYVLYILVLIVL